MLHESHIVFSHIGGKMVGVQVSSPVDRGFEPRSGQNQRL